jgi:hypothetical protein
MMEEGYVLAMAMWPWSIAPSAVTGPRMMEEGYAQAMVISMFANFVRGLRDKAPEAILEVRTNLGEARSHARTYHMPGDSFEPVR